MEMQEKIMVADTLTGINGELIRYAEMIPQTENKEQSKGYPNLLPYFLNLKTIFYCFKHVYSLPQVTPRKCF